MITFNRRHASLAMLASLAACGSSGPSSAPAPQFKRYSGPPVTQVAVYKGQRRMHLLNGQTVLRSYDFGLGNQPVGHKQFEGDGKTPEGIYKIDRRNDRSKFHLSLGINYPLPEDRARAKKGGYSPGGDIFIHGQPNQIPDGFRVKGDWTEGCIAVADHEMDEIFAMTRLGTEVEIRP